MTVILMVFNYAVTQKYKMTDQQSLVLNTIISKKIFSAIPKDWLISATTWRHDSITSLLAFVVSKSRALQSCIRYPVALSVCCKKLCELSVPFGQKWFHCRLGEGRVNMPITDDIRLCVWLHVTEMTPEQSMSNNNLNFCSTCCPPLNLWYDIFIYQMYIDGIADRCGASDNFFRNQLF